VKVEAFLASRRWVRSSTIFRKYSHKGNAGKRGGFQKRFRSTSIHAGHVIQINRLHKNDRFKEGVVLNMNSLPTQRT
jgi:hypothetical protein